MGVNLGCVLESSKLKTSLKSGANMGFWSWSKSTWDMDPTGAFTKILVLRMAVTTYGDTNAHLHVSGGDN